MELDAAGIDCQFLFLVPYGTLHFVQTADGRA
jgi:hypothetical protein